MNNGQFRVKPLFHIQPIHSHPYKVTFLQPVSEEGEDNPRVLVLIRGNTKVILDKTYGK